MRNSNHNIRNTDKTTTYNFFKNHPFTSTIFEQNKLDYNLRSAASLSVFKKNLLKSIRSSRNSICNSQNCKGFNGFDVETNTHFFHCPW